MIFPGRDFAEMVVFDCLVQITFIRKCITEDWKKAAREE